MPIVSLPRDKPSAVEEEEKHASEHQHGGADEINVGGLSGTLTDNQPPEAHAPTHKAGNSDELSVADLGNILGVDEIKMDTAANLTAGTADRLCVETDTGRALYDNGTSFVEVGLSESQIALGSLGSHAHSELTGIGASDHHAKTVSADIDHDKISGVSASDHHAKYTDSEARTACDGAIDADTLDGVQLAAIDWGNVAMATSDISKADVGLGSVENIALSTAGWGDIGISKGDITSGNWGDYEIQKNGAGGTGTINFKTS